MAWISSLVTPFLSAPLRCNSHSCIRPRQASMTRFSIERVFLDRRSSVHTMPQQYSLRISWNGALNASAIASEVLTYASPSTALRTARPLSRSALSMCHLPGGCGRRQIFVSVSRAAQGQLPSPSPSWDRGWPSGPRMRLVVDGQETRAVDLGIDLGGRKAGVTQELLDLPQIRSRGEQV